jgi:4-amino-4-deoxy-L-arabinose transferase-like glycosyltransferase
MLQRSPWYRRESALIACLTLLGAALRLWNLPRLGLEHFDEGIYALSGLWIVSPRGLAGIDPMVIPYAPPGLPILIGACYFITMPVWPRLADLSAIAPSLMCGIATIPVVAWLGRRTFGPGAGVAVASMVALSGAHVAFSRMALTDVPFLLAWVTAVGLGTGFLERPGLSRSIACGLAVGVAQNFKYNGWLAGVIIGLAALLGLADRRQESRRAILYGVVAAVVALGVYAPWILFVERHGGYASLTAHHRSYIGGVGRWVPHLRQQLAQVVALAGLVSGRLTWTGIAWCLAWVGCALVGAPGTDAELRWRSLRFRAGLLGGIMAFGVFPDLPWWLGLVWLPALLRDRRPAVRVLAVWWIVMSILTPFYYPYARVWLPLSAAGWLVAARAAVLWWERDGSSAGGRVADGHQGRRIAWAIPLAALSCAAATDFGLRPTPQPLPHLLARTNSVREFVLGNANMEVIRAVGGGLLPTYPADPVMLLARPCFSFYLQAYLGATVHPFPNWHELQRSEHALGSGVPRLVLVDEVQLRQEPSDAELTDWRRRSFDFRPPEDLLNGPTLLDADPQAAFGRSLLGGQEWSWPTAEAGWDAPRSRIMLFRGNMPQ